MKKAFRRSDFTEDITQSEAWKKASKLYPNKEIHVTKTGRIYIKSVDIITSSNPFGYTEKAIRYGNIWVPKSHGFVKSSYGGSGTTHYKFFVSEQFLDKFTQRRNTSQIIKDIESLIEDLKKLRNAKEALNDEFTSPELTQKRIRSTKKDIEDVLSILERDKEEFGEELYNEALEEYYQKIITKEKEIESSGSEGYIKQETKVLTLMRKALSKASGKGKGWFGESERHSQARKMGKADTLDFCLYDMVMTLDVTRGPGRPRSRGLKAGTPSAMVSGAKRTKVGRSIGPEGFQVGGVESITVPFELMNTETGQIFKGNVVENLEKNIKQLTPISSSNVRGVGQFNNELLVQFHPKGLTPLRTYRYQFENPQMAEEAYRGLTTTGSPGRWIWQNVRGHTKGEPVTPSKIGPALLTGNPTIGGTTKSLVDYKISNRVPVQRVQGFEGGVSKLKRTTSNPTTNPQTGQMIESLLGTRKGFRDIGLPRTAILSQLPKLDFTMIYVGTLIDDISEEELEARFKVSQKKIQARKEQEKQECTWITKNGKHICITPKEPEKIEIPEKVSSKIRGGGGALVGTCIRVAENFIKENKKLSNETIQELIDRYGFGTKDIKHFVENFDRYTKSAKKFIATQKERDKERQKFEEKLKNQPLRNAENVQSENDLIENVSKYEVFRYVERSELDILSNHDNKNEIFLVAGQNILFTGDRHKVIVGADQIPEGCTIIHTHPVATRGKFKGLACPFSPTDYLTFLTTEAQRSIVFVQDGSGYMIEKPIGLKEKLEYFVKRDLKTYEKQASTEIVNEDKSVDCGLFRFNRLICEKYNLKLKKFRWK